MAKIMKGNLQLNIKTSIIGLMLVGIVICFSSCQDKDEFTPDPISGDVNEFYADVQGSHEWDSFDAATDHIFITDSNTSVHIPANSLVYDDGSDVVGEISVSLQDYLNMGELIVHNVTAMMSSDRILSSEGVLFVSFAQGNEVLSVKPASLVTIRVPEPNASVDAILYDDGGEPIVFDWQVSGQTMSLESWDFTGMVRTGLIADMSSISLDQVGITLLWNWILVFRLISQSALAYRENFLMEPIATCF